MLKGQTVLVTGGSGYLGEVIVNKLIRHGYHVRVLDLLPPTINVEFVKGDICDKFICKKALSGVDIVIHCVALVPLVKDDREFWRVNSEGTRQILQSSIEQNVEHFIYISSSAVYGIPEVLPVTHLTPRNPFEEYGSAKKSGEDEVEKYRGYGLKASIVRPRTILGHNRLGLFSPLFRWINDGINIPMFGAENALYQFIHVDDLAEGIIAAAKMPSAGNYNLGAVEYQSLDRDLMNLVIHAKSNSRIVYFRSKAIRRIVLRMCDLKFFPFARYQIEMLGSSMYFDCAEDWERLGVSPKYSNFEALRSSYDSFSNRIHQGMQEDNSKMSPHKSILRSRTINSLTYLLKLITIFQKRFK